MRLTNPTQRGLDWRQRLLTNVLSDGVVNSDSLREVSVWVQLQAKFVIHHLARVDIELANWSQ